MEPLTTTSTRAELLALGHNDDGISRAVATGKAAYLGPGIYGPPDGDDDARRRDDRHRDAVRAWARKMECDGRASSRALADVSAVAALGLPLFGVPTDKYVVQDFSRSPGARTSKFSRIVSDLRPASVVVVPGVAVPVVSPARTVVDIARRYGRVPAVVIGDAVLHGGLATRSELHEELALARGMSGVGRAREAVSLMNGLAESVLESRSRIEMRDLGLPVPMLQPSFYIGRMFIGRVDFWWPEFLLVGEADGDLKYTNDASAAFREKARTDEFYRAGARMVRWNWRHVNVPTRLDARIRPMMTVPQAPLLPTVRIEFPTPPAE